MLFVFQKVLHEVLKSLQIPLFHFTFSCPSPIILPALIVHSACFPLSMLELVWCRTELTAQKDEHAASIALTGGDSYFIYSRSETVLQFCHFFLSCSVYLISVSLTQMLMFSYMLQLSSWSSWQKRLVGNADWRWWLNEMLFPLPVVYEIL